MWKRRVWRQLGVLSKSFFSSYQHHPYINFNINFNFKCYSKMIHWNFFFCIVRGVLSIRKNEWKRNDQTTILCSQKTISEFCYIPACWFNFTRTINWVEIKSMLINCYYLFVSFVRVLTLTILFLAGKVITRQIKTGCR